MMHPEYEHAIADAREYAARNPGSRLVEIVADLGKMLCRWCKRPRNEHPPGETGPRCAFGGPLAFDREGRERWATDGGR
jgi:hypothetical protein